jgi:hypothetical protein
MPEQSSFEQTSLPPDTAKQAEVEDTPQKTGLEEEQQAKKLVSFEHGRPNGGL